MDIWRKISINNDNKWRTDREDEGEDEKAQSESVRKGHGGISSSSGGLNPPEQDLCAHLTVILCRKHVCYEKWPNLSLQTRSRRFAARAFTHRFIQRTQAGLTLVQEKNTFKSSKEEQVWGKCLSRCGEK